MAIQRHADARAAKAGEFVTEGETSGWLTPQGLLPVAIRRNLSNLATADIGLVLCMDLSRWTCARAEVRAGACLIASSRSFWRAWQQQIWGTRQEHHSLTVLAYREDATNASVWRKSKMMALDIEARHAADISPDDIIRSEELSCDLDEVGIGVTRIKRLADVLPVSKDHETGKGTLILTEKLLESLGCPSWKTFLRNRPNKDPVADIALELPRLGLQKATGLCFGLCPCMTRMCVACKFD